MLTQSHWQGAELGALIRGQAIVDANEAEARIFVDGPRVALPAQVALHLALVFHELSTNARKHGALSSDEGEVTATWSIEQTNSHVKVSLDWNETGGPPPCVEAERDQGFGTKLIRRSVESLESGEAEMRLQVAGVRWSITFLVPITGAVTVPTSSLVVDDESREPEVPATEEPQGKTVLVVEDEALVSLLIEDALVEGGFEVVGPVSSVEDGLRALADRDCDAALLDVNLRGKPVDELARALARRNIPFAFVTGYGSHGLSGDFANAPILTKPFRMETLVETTRAMLTRPANVPTTAA